MLSLSVLRRKELKSRHPACKKGKASFNICKLFVPDFPKRKHISDIQTYQCPISQSVRKSDVATLFRMRLFGCRMWVSTLPEEQPK